MNILGIDPGLSGGICLLNQATRYVYNLSTMPESIMGFLQLLQGERSNISHCYLEKAQAMPKQGVSSMFTYGKHFGELIGVLTALAVPFTLVTPHSWQRSIHAGTDAHLTAKERTLQAAIRLYPDQTFLAGPRCRKVDFGLVDALMIAEYGVRTSR